MRALVCHSPRDWNDLVVEDIAPPQMLPGGVRIAIACGAVSFAMSLQVAGKYQRTYPQPFTPGGEVAGTVMEVAPGVTQVKPGDRVLAVVDWGALAEQVVVPAATVYPLPAALPFDPSIHLTNAYSTAYGSLFWRGRLLAGETVLVLGAAGAVGVAAVELARNAGAHVIAAASTPEKRAFALAHGAHAAVTNDNLRDAVMQATNNEGVDLVYDPVGNPLFDAALRTVKPFGRIVTLGFAGGQIPQIPANLLLVKNIAVIGFNIGLYYGWSPRDERLKHEPVMRAMMNELFQLAEDGKLRPHVSHRFKLEEFREAMRVVLARESHGKVIIRIGENR